MTDHREELRLQELARIDPGVAASEASFDIITGMVQKLLDVPMVAITLIDKDTQRLKARQGIEIDCCPREVAVCDIVVRSGKPLFIDDMQTDDRVAANPAVTGEMHLRAYAGAPLTTRSGHHLGALCALDVAPRQFTPEQIAVLSNFAKVVTELLELRAMADHDFLTGLLNRRGFEAVLERELGRQNRKGTSATLAMLDLDHFKTVNDTYGHPVGDLVLKALAGIVTSRLRKHEYLARMGGEEFALLLTDTSLEAAVKVADRIRETVAAFRMKDYPDLSLTVSIGLVDVSRYARDFAGLMREVDAAVYDAKSSGRNRTSVIPKGEVAIPGTRLQACG